MQTERRSTGRLHASIGHVTEPVRLEDMRVSDTERSQ
jgi:hypothetical protein